MNTRYNQMFPALIGVVALLGSIFVLPFGARTGSQPLQQATPAPIQRTISVSGTGTSQATPNLARVVLGVQTTGETASAALTANSEQMEGLMTALRSAGIAAADLQTRTIQLFPRYSDTPVTGTPEDQAAQNTITGYTAVNTLVVTVRDLDGLGELIDSAVTAGSNQIESITFDLDEPVELVDQAREAAFADAQRKAGQLATLAGGTLGSVVSVTETSYFPVAFQNESVAMDRMAASVPISSGSQTISVDVQVVFELVVSDTAEE